MEAQRDSKVRGRPSWGEVRESVHSSDWSDIRLLKAGAGPGNPQLSGSCRPSWTAPQPHHMQAGWLSSCPHQLWQQGLRSQRILSWEREVGIQSIPDHRVHGLWEPACLCCAHCCSYFQIPDGFKVCDDPKFMYMTKYIP